MKIDSIPEILKYQFGNLANAMAKGTGLSEMTVAKYRYDFNCEFHIIVDGVLFTRHKTTKGFDVNRNLVPGRK